MTIGSSTATTGQPAPDFRLEDQDGREFHLADAGQPVVLVFLRGFS